MHEIRNVKYNFHKNKLIPDHFGLLPTGVGKCQHLPKWFGKSLN
jgi:transglutaminase-like putative cysteine protease